MVESLLRLVVEPESERASYDGLALWRERDEGIGGGAWEPDLVWFIEVKDFCGRTWRGAEREGAPASLSLSSYRPRSGSLVLAAERERGPGPLGRPARERLDMAESVEARNKKEPPNRQSQLSWLSYKREGQYMRMTTALNQSNVSRADNNPSNSL